MPDFTTLGLRESVLVPLGLNYCMKVLKSWHFLFGIELWRAKKTLLSVAQLLYFCDPEAVRLDNSVKLKHALEEDMVQV